MRDLSDVQDLNIALNLPLNFTQEIDASVRPEYERLRHGARSGMEPEE